MATFTTPNETYFAAATSAALGALLTAVTLTGGRRKGMIEVAERNLHSATLYAGTPEEALIATKLADLIETMHEQNLTV